MLDNYTTLVYGWKLTGDKVNEIQNELEDFDEDFWDKFQDIMVEDSMCGDYFYFGAILAHYDCNEEDSLVIDDDLIEKSTDKYNKAIYGYPQLKEIFDKYKNGEPKLYVFQNIW